MVHKLLMHKQNCIGISISDSDRKTQPQDTRNIYGKEVILCGGAVNSPQLLQLSGIGPKSLLTKNGIECIPHLPGVGENMKGII